MLNTLHIKNYKGLRDFRIESLGRINLLLGKNNVGKSSILEAVDLYSSRFDLAHIIQLLALRSEDLSAFNINPEITSKDEIESLLPFVTDRDIHRLISDGISIKVDSNELRVKLVRYILSNTEKGVEFSVFPIENEEIESDVALVLENTDGKVVNLLLSLDGGGLKSTFKKIDQPKYSVKYLSARDSKAEKEMLTDAWSEIAMSDLEPYVVDALKIVDERIVRFNIIGKDSIPFVTILGYSKPIRLSSMGDGLNKVLRIILALLSCKNGVLLIDEIENGLHHSITDKLWEVIFELSSKLNVQVLATTHSNDCVMSFIKAYDGSGSLIRLESIGEEIKAVAYDEDEMKTIYKRMDECRKKILDVR